MTISAMCSSSLVMAFADGDAIAFQQEAIAGAPRRHVGATDSVVPCSVLPSSRFVFTMVVTLPWCSTHRAGSPDQPGSQFPIHLDRQIATTLGVSVLSCEFPSRAW